MRLCRITVLDALRCEVAESMICIECLDYDYKTYRFSRSTDNAGVSIIHELPQKARK